MNLSAKFTYDVKSYRTLLSVTMFRLGSPILMLLLTWGLSVLCCYLNLVKNAMEGTFLDLPFKIVSVILILLTAWITFNFLVVPHISVKQLRAKGIPWITIRFFTDHITVDAEREGLSEHAEAAYSQLLKVVETKEYFLLFNGKNSGYIVPKAALEGGTAAELTELLKACTQLPYTVRNL